VGWVGVCVGGGRLHDGHILRDVLPIRDINPTSRFAWVTLGLILLNVATFLFWQPTLQGDPARQQAFFFCHAEIPYEVSHQTDLADAGPGAIQAIEEQLGASPAEAADVQQTLRDLCPHKSWLLSLFTSMFLHGGWLHLGGNMLYLWIFGNNVEDRLGPLRYLLFYLLGGLAASALELAFSPDSVVPTLGASGAIAAVLGSYLVMFPRARVLTLVFFILPVSLPAVVVLGGWFVLQLFHGVGGLGTQVNGGVAYWAHVGGFVFGMLATRLFVRRAQDRRGPAALR
jgi:membrane associated rhomboid family serine protease